MPCREVGAGSKESLAIILMAAVTLQELPIERSGFDQRHRVTAMHAVVVDPKPSSR
jgi:hypothetical protein